MERLQGLALQQMLIAQQVPNISLAKTRGATLGSSTIVNNNDVLGAVLFSGADGVDANTQAAYITCNVDGTPGANDMPGRLVFSTTADGAGSPTERMRITSQGFIKASNTGSYVTNTSGTSATQHEISNSTVGRDVIQFYNTSSNPYGIFLRFSNATPNNTLNYFLYWIVPVKGLPCVVMVVLQTINQTMLIYATSVKRKTLKRLIDLGLLKRMGA